jgi:hypothetical protein
METAFQGWILVVLSLNAVAMLFLLRQLGVHSFIGCPVTIFAVSSSALVYKLGHPQILPFFPFIFCLGYTCKFLLSPEAKSFTWAVLWLAYQNWCYMYHGYFTLLICGTAAGLYLLIFARPEFWRRLFRSFREHRLLVIGTLVFAMAALVFVYAPYASFSARAGTRPGEEVANLAPNPGAWFSASPKGLFYSKQQFYKAEANTGENTLFGGWSFWVLTPVIMVTAVRHRERPDMKVVLVLITTVFIIIGCTTSWANNAGNLYVMIAKHVQSIRAFRAVARIAYLLFVVEAIVIATFLNYHYRKATHRWRRAVIFLIACIVPAESFAFRQESYVKADAQRRADALVEMWKRAGDREVLVFAPGYTNQPFEYLNTECWQAALLVNKKTVNGYSGIWPPSHTRFLMAPTEANARALLSSLNISPQICSIVTDWREDIKQRDNIRVVHPEGHAAPITSVKQISLHPLQLTSIPVSIHNEEKQDLECDFLRIYASYRLYDANGTPISDPSSPRTEVHALKSGEDKPLNLKLLSPSRPGKYEARLSMVHEAVAWWADLGSPGSAIEITVVDSNGAAAGAREDTKYHLGTRLGFGLRGNSERFRIAGWSKTESKMTWTDGHSAMLHFSGLPRLQPLSLQVTMSGLTKNPHLPAQIAQVSANGTKLAEWQIAEKKEYVVTIPPDVVSDTGNLTIEFAIPNAISPRALGLSTDSRELGLCLFDLVIREVR